MHSFPSVLSFCLLFASIVLFLLPFLLVVQAVNCREEPNGNAYIWAAPEIQCWEGAHLYVAMPLAWIGVLLVGIAYPVALLVTFVRFQRSGTDPSQRFFDVS